MIYLVWYLSIGVVALIVMRTSYWLSTASKSNFKQEIMKFIHTEKETWHGRLIDNVAMPLLAWMLVIIAWPVAVYMKVKEILFPYKVAPRPEEKKFSVAKENLLRQMTVEEIERQERVTDPMDAVPDIPFGHLNAVWSRFKGNLEPQDSIWAFSAQWTAGWKDWAGWGSQEIREGYVIVRADSIGPHFLKTLRMLR